MAMQAWFEIHPARVTKKNPSLENFDPPVVVDAPDHAFDENGLGTEPNNVTAVNSLIGYRALRFGKNVEVILTDQRSYRSKEPTGDPAAAPLQDLPFFPRTFRSSSTPAASERRQTAGEDQVRHNRDRQLPERSACTDHAGRYAESMVHRQTESVASDVEGLGQYAGHARHTRRSAQSARRHGQEMAGRKLWRLRRRDPSTAYVERNEIYDVIAREGITGFATVAGDRHSFLAGVATRSLPPRGFEPVGIAFVTAPSRRRAWPSRKSTIIRKTIRCARLYLMDREGGKFETTVNLTMHHGVRTALEYAKSGDIAKAARAAKSR